MMKEYRILIVEDNDALREMFRRRLIRRKYNVELANDGEEGLVKAAEHPPDLILLDMSLPGKNGWTIASELKSKSQTKNTPIIAITAHAMRGDRERALQAGCDDYISKPINFQNLYAAMDRLLQP
ncbi:response regulator [Coraliomargarita sp. SDUM461003]|uniref:Response regulator n=1 Tax=Thalassobacterium maritimum TaxID=3041265 RepID=A0ABU1AZ62_9BACT|nr:response regulator [Coraliomargarita sp. SDUM461003]MDQ8209445.1 response regulator [Coraliomargarita sp. SDUM461003]